MQNKDGNPAYSLRGTLPAAKRNPPIAPWKQGEVKTYCYDLGSRSRRTRSKRSRSGRSDRRRYKKSPITSYGIILFYIEKNPGSSNHGEPMFLVSRRRDTIAYVDFVRGNYFYNDLKTYFELMTQEERLRLLSHSFEDVWDDLYINHQSKLYKEEYVNAKRAYELVRDQIPIVISQTSSTLKEPDWGFPKGKRYTYESEKECALREFHEETKISLENIRILSDWKPLIEVFKGTNGKIYKTVYFVAISTSKLDITYIPLDGSWNPYYTSSIRQYTVSEEIGDLKWCNLGEAKCKLNIRRQNLLNKLYIKWREKSS